MWYNNPAYCEYTIFDENCFFKGVLKSELFRTLRKIKQSKLHKYLLSMEVLGKVEIQLNKTTDYAIRMIIYLARENKMLTTEELAEHICVTENYTRKILRKLAKGGIANLKSGINGGVILKKTPGEISLYDIISTMEMTMKSINVLKKIKSVI